MVQKLYALKKVTGHDGKEVDNTKVTWDYWNKKLVEEVKELIEAIDLKDKVKIMEETLDIIQVCIGMMAKLYKEGLTIENGIRRHNKKLSNRGCDVAAEIRFSVVRKNGKF